MHGANLFTNSLLLFTVPALVAYPLADVPDVQIYPHHALQNDSRPSLQVNNELFSYDDVLDLLDEIEEGDIEDRCTPEEIDGINRFMALLAKEGIFPNNGDQELALNRDIDALLFQESNPWTFAYSLDGGYSIEPAVSYGGAGVVHCRSWAKKKWDKTRKFVKKHKNEIIIGAAIVAAVAATVAIVVVVATSSAASAIAAGAAVGVASAASSSTPSNSDSHEIEMVAIPIQEVPGLKEAIDDQVYAFKEKTALESIINPEKSLNVESPSFVENVRDFGAALAHSVLSGVSEVASIVPGFLEDLRDVGERFIPREYCDIRPSNEFNPLGNYEFSVDKGHKAIDRFFGVEQTQNHAEPIFNFQPEFTYATLPPPGAVGPSVANEGRIPPTQANSMCGWKVGKPIQNRTFWGGVPKWSSVRSRYWKTRAQWAKANPNKNYYGEHNIPRMERGLAPQDFNRNTGQLESMELHHIPPQREGGLFDFIEVWPHEHAKLDPKRHIGR